MKTEIIKFVAGPLENNTYLIRFVNSALIVDPAVGMEELFEYVKKEKISITAILLTHGHFDHFTGLAEILKQYPTAPIYAHPLEIAIIADPTRNGSNMIGGRFSYTGKMEPLTEGECTIDPFNFTVFHIPGHSPGGLAFVFDDDCITGDSLFAGSIGRTDFPGCDSKALLDNIRTKLLTLPEETVIYPGHGNRSTIGREKRLNPFLR